MAAVALGTTGTENIVDRAVKELQGKFRHVVIYTDQASGDAKIHVPDPDHCSRDFTDEQRDAYADLVSTYGIHENEVQDVKGGTPLNKPLTPTPNTADKEPTETSYLALSELTKEWDVVPAPVLEHAEPSAAHVSLHSVDYIYICVAQ